MKVIATKERLFTDKAGNGVLQLKIPNLRHQKMLEGLEGDLLSVELKKAKNLRSIEQNKLMWALLSDIDKKMNGERSNDSWSIYLEALRRAGAKCEYIVASIEAEDRLKKSVRALEFVRMAEQEGYAVYRVYLGSSTFNTKEMTVLIETILDMAAICGIDTVYWKEVLR